jgi:hypothetical protein
VIVGAFGATASALGVSAKSKLKPTAVMNSLIKGVRESDMEGGG